MLTTENDHLSNQDMGVSVSVCVYICKLSKQAQIRLQQNDFLKRNDSKALLPLPSKP